jgi:ketosteroid isomerase-like protein
MSQENVEIARAILADWERGDWTSAAWADAEIEFVRADQLGGTTVGLAGMAEAWREWLSPWVDFRIAEVDEYRELDGKRVLVFHRFTARAKNSGLLVEQTRTTGASLFEFDSGKVTRLVAYSPRERALADLGLEE